MIEKKRVLIILPLDVTDQDDFNKSIDQIVALEIPAYRGVAHIAVDDMADKIIELLEGPNA